MLGRVLDEPLVTGMIELRRRREWWFKRSPHPDKRPGFAMWRAPEFAILSIAKSFAALRQDGLTEAEAIARIDERRQLGVLDGQATTLEAYIRLVLARYAPRYLDFGDSHLLEVLALAQAEMAKRYAALPAARGRSADVWGAEQVSVEDFRQKLATSKRLQGSGPMLFPRDGFDEELTQLLVRLDDGDEIWNWRTPPGTWPMMMGRGGFTVVRNNRPIATVMTVMN